MFRLLLCVALMGVTLASVPDCPRTIYSGYPCCKIEVDNTVSDTVDCAAAQKTVFSAGVEGCPDPAFKPPDDLSKENMQPFPAGAPKGRVNFLVYRAVKLDDKYALILANSNAADRAGTLSYLHAEVVPEDARGTEVIKTSTRRLGIDVVIVFNVTVYNPGDPSEPDIPLSAYVAFDRGTCSNKDPGCVAYKTEGYKVGFQREGGNQRTNYTANKQSDYWYSFPKGGLCDKPNGTNECTYSYEVVGKIVIDEMVHLDRLGYANYSEFAKYDATTGTSANIEFSRKGKDGGEFCTTTGGIPFWHDPCDLKQCLARIERMMATEVRPIKDYKFYNNTMNCGKNIVKSSGLSTGEIIAIIVGSLVAVGIGIGIFSYMAKSKNKQEKQPLMDTA